MSRTYQTATFQKVYDAIMACARDCSSELYHNRLPRRGASHRACFWAGFDGGRRPLWVGGVGTMGNVCYMAGKDFAREVMRAGTIYYYAPRSAS